MDAFAGVHRVDTRYAETAQRTDPQVEEALQDRAERQEENAGEHHEWSDFLAGMHDPIPASAHDAPLPDYVPGTMHGTQGLKFFSNTIGYKADQDRVFGKVADEKSDNEREMFVGLPERSWYIWRTQVRTVVDGGMVQHPNGDDGFPGSDVVNLNRIRCMLSSRSEMDEFVRLLERVVDNPAAFSPRRESRGPLVVNERLRVIDEMTDLAGLLYLVGTASLLQGVSLDPPVFYVGPNATLVAEGRQAMAEPRHETRVGEHFARKFSDANPACDFGWASPTMYGFTRNSTREHSEHSDFRLTGLAFTKPFGRTVDEDLYEATAEGLEEFFEARDEATAEGLEEFFEARGSPETIGPADLAKLCGRVHGPASPGDNIANYAKEWNPFASALQEMQWSGHIMNRLRDAMVLMSKDPTRKALFGPENTDVQMAGKGCMLSMDTATALMFSGFEFPFRTGDVLGGGSVEGVLGNPFHTETVYNFGKGFKTRTERGFGLRLARGAGEAVNDSPKDNPCRNAGLNLPFYWTSEALKLYTDRTWEGEHVAPFIEAVTGSTFLDHVFQSEEEAMEPDRPAGTSAAEFEKVLGDRVTAALSQYERQEFLEFFVKQSRTNDGMSYEVRLERARLLCIRSELQRKAFQHYDGNSKTFQGKPVDMRALHQIISAPQDKKDLKAADDGLMQTQQLYLEEIDIRLAEAYEELKEARDADPDAFERRSSDFRLYERMCVDAAEKDEHASKTTEVLLISNEERMVAIEAKEAAERLNLFPQTREERESGQYEHPQWYPNAEQRNAAVRYNRLAREHNKPTRTPEYAAYNPAEKPPNESDEVTAEQQKRLEEQQHLRLLEIDEMQQMQLADTLKEEQEEEPTKEQPPPQPEPEPEPEPAQPSSSAPSRSRSPALALAPAKDDDSARKFAEEFAERQEAKRQEAERQEVAREQQKREEQHEERSREEQARQEHAFELREREKEKEELATELFLEQQRGQQQRFRDRGEEEQRRLAEEREQLFMDEQRSLAAEREAALEKRKATEELQTEHFKAEEQERQRRHMAGGGGGAPLQFQPGPGGGRPQKQPGPRRQGPPGGGGRPQKQPAPRRQGPPGGGGEPGPVWRAQPEPEPEPQAGPRRR